MTVNKNSGSADSRAVALSVTFYMVTSIVMLMANKMVLLKVALPVTFLCGQLLVAVALLHAGHWIARLTLPYLGIRHAKHWLARFELPPFQLAACKRLWPLILTNVVGLTLNTYTIHLGDASFYQIARGLVLPLTVALSWAYLSRPSYEALGCCAVVTAGYLMGTLMDSSSVEISTGAVVLGALSSATTAIHTIVIKNAIQDTGNMIDLVYYNNLLSAAALPLVMLLNGEATFCLNSLRDFLRSAETPGLQNDGAQTFLFGCLLTGAIGFMLNVASFFQIQVTSPVTHVISSSARGVLQALIAVALFHETVTNARAGSILVITLGSALYTFVKHRETKKRAQSLQSYAPV
ncbi:hypothetical protein HDU86_007768 [Geranomyces michiganensis]|nr:hypothetical protein HDU86_007768 [Geranomyces michiganensis]